MVIPVALAAIVSTFTSSIAQEHDAAADSAAHASAEHDAEHHGGGHAHKNDVAAFIGATRNDNHDSVHFTIGFDYVRKVGPTGYWAIGIMPEYVFAEEPELVVFLPLMRAVGPNLEWTLRMGPGWGWRFGDDEREGPNEPDEHASGSADQLSDEPPLGEEFGDSSTFMFRMGVAYSFAFDNAWYISPSVDIDFGGHRNRFLVVGVSFAKGF